MRVSKDKCLHAVKNANVEFRVGGKVRHERGDAGRTGYWECEKCSIKLTCDGMTESHFQQCQSPKTGVVSSL